MLWKVTMVAQLGLIGGTMGLFSGFSILIFKIIQIIKIIQRWLWWHSWVWLEGQWDSFQASQSLFLKSLKLLKLFKLLKLSKLSELFMIGGTMDLFSGFSILSGIEIVYFASKFLFKRKLTCCKNKREFDVWCDFIPEHFPLKPHLLYTWTTN